MKLSNTGWFVFVQVVKVAPLYSLVGTASRGGGGSSHQVFPSIQLHGGPGINQDTVRTLLDGLAKYTLNSVT